MFASCAAYGYQENGSETSNKRGSILKSVNCTEEGSDIKSELHLDVIRGEANDNRCALVHDMVDICCTSNSSSEDHQELGLVLSDLYQGVQKANIASCSRLNRRGIAFFTPSVCQVHV